MKTACSGISRAGGRKRCGAAAEPAGRKAGVKLKTVGELVDKLKNEAAVWERAALRISTERKMNLTMLIIQLIAGALGGNAAGSLLKKVKLEIAVNDDFVRPTIEAIAGGALEALARELGIDRTNVADVLNRLARRRLLERRRSRDDGRMVLARLTRAGERLTRKMYRPMRRAQRRLLAPLLSQERLLLGWGNHPFFAHAEMVTLLAERGGKVAGRLAAFVNGIAWNLERLAEVAFARMQWERGAQLWGAAEALRETRYRQR